MGQLVDKEFDIIEGQTAVLKLRPVNDAGGDAKIENVDFHLADDSQGVGLSVRVDDPLTFDLAIPLGLSGDVGFVLHADGHVGPGESVIDQTFVAHVSSKDAVKVQLDVSINQA